MFPTTPDLKGQIRLCVALALTVALGVTGANAATASFTDVPPENQFAESVTRVQESGIATGYPDGSFRPKDPINRQQAAAWVDRSAGRVSFGVNPDGSLTLSSTLPSAVIAQTEATSPAAPGGQGWVTIQGGVGGVSTAPGTTCPCTAEIFVLDEEDNVIGRSALTVQNDPTGSAATVSPFLGVTQIDGGESHLYRVVVTLVDPSQEMTISGGVYAVYSPMVNGSIPTIDNGESHSTDGPVMDLAP